jgi:hypothetical protein
VKPPKWLTDPHARQFWRDHINGIQPDQHDSFAQQCEVWGELRSLPRPLTDRSDRMWYIALSKQFAALERHHQRSKPVEQAPVGPTLAEIVKAGLA